jgi:hypothetical protein
VSTNSTTWAKNSPKPKAARPGRATIDFGLEYEAPSGLEPLNKGFADLSLSHLGTAPWYVRNAKIQLCLPLQTCIDIVMTDVNRKCAARDKKKLRTARR